MAAAESRFFQDFKVLKALSRYGGFRFGFILKAQNKLDGLNYAVKIAIDDSKYEIDEVTTFARLEPAHPNLVSYKNAWKDKLTQAELNSIKHPLKCLIDDFIKGSSLNKNCGIPIFCIQMELCSSDLRIWLHELKFFSEQLNNSIIFQISQGIQYLHEKKFIHRNLKPENIFFDAKNKKCVKIGDFKFNDAHRYDTSTTRNKGTLNYMAPEQDADKNSYNNPEVDLFALGIILMELYLAPNIIASRQQTKFSSIVNGLKVQKVTPDTIDRYPIVVDIILCLTKFEPRERENKIGQLDPKNKSNGFPGKVFSGRSNTGHHVVPNQKLIEAKKMYEKEMDNQLQTAQKKFIEPQELKEIHKKVSRHVFKQMNILPRDEDIYHNVLYTTFNVYLFKNEKNIPSPPALGIVLGTTYSCVAIYHNGSVEIIPDNNGDKIIPSFVSFGTCEILVGMPAKEQAHKFPETTIFDAKRLIGRKFEDPNIQRDANLWPFKVVNDRGNPSIEIRGENHVPESISAKILFQLAKMAEDYLHQKITRAVITVPAYFNDGQRQATRDAGEIAGLEVLAIIDEPSSAAIAYQLDSLQNEDEKIILIFDLGGGTFDISILRAKYSTMKVITKIGDTYLGGEDFDSKMVEWCVEKFVKKEKLDPSEGLNSTDEMTKSYASRRLRRLRNKCEEAKRKLSMGQEAWIKLHAFQNGIDFSECMTRNEFEVMNLDKFQRTIELVGKALQDAKLTKDQIDDIVLVGGSTKIPKIQELLCTFFNGKTLKKSIQVDEVVARGAAIKAALLNGNIDSKIKNIQIADVTPFSLGIELEGGEFSKIIAKNTPIPTLKRSPLFTNIEDMQENACISIYEGEDKVANKNYLLGEFFLILAKKKEGEEKIEVQMEINGDGILKVTAISLDAGHENEITIQEHRGRLSRAEILEIKMKEDVGVKNEDLLKSLSESGKIDGELLKNLKFNPSRRSNVMVSFKNGQTTPVINEIASKFGPETSGPEKAYAIKSGLGSFSAQSQSSTLNYLSNVPATSFSNFESFWISNQLLIRGATAPLITALSIQPNIANVAEEKKTHLIDGVINSELIQNPRQSNGLQWGVDKVRAQMAWDAGYRGQGIIVAVIDTGTRMTHQILRNNYVGRENNGWLDATFNPRNWWSRPSQDPTDDQGHGTHCTGSITGTNGYGVAPDAKWMACKALNAAGSGTQSDLLECMQFTLCPTKPDGSGADCSKKPHIVSNSWGGSSDEVDPKYEDAINAWRNADIIPVFAAGNSGEDGCSTMGSPGASKNVIAVGATDRNDAIASFSSRGPVKGNRLMKPEISAPGVDINSAGHQRDTAYRVMSGTSMACPHVAGLVALQLSRDPNLKYNDILNAMTYNAEKQSLTKGSETCDGKSQSEFPNNHFGNGRIDAFMTLMNDVPSK